MDAGSLPRLVSYSAHVVLRQSLVLCLDSCVPDVGVLEHIAHCRATLLAFFSISFIV